jgi:hypothetical protein
MLKKEKACPAVIKMMKSNQFDKQSNRRLGAWLSVPK